MGQATEQSRSAEVVNAGRPALFLAAAFLALQGLTAIAYGVLTLATFENATVGVVIGVVGISALWGLGLLLIARGVALCRYWSRGPAVAMQLLLIPLAWGFRASFGWASGLLFLSLAVVLVCLFLPTSNHIFTAGRRLPGQLPGEH